MTIFMLPLIDDVYVAAGTDNDHVGIMKIGIL